LMKCLEQVEQVHDKGEFSPLFLLCKEVKRK